MIQKQKFFLKIWPTYCLGNRYIYLRVMRLAKSIR